MEQCAAASDRRSSPVAGYMGNIFNTYIGDNFS